MLKFCLFTDLLVESYCPSIYMLFGIDKHCHFALILAHVHKCTMLINVFVFPFAF